MRRPCDCAYRTLHVGFLGRTVSHVAVIAKLTALRSGSAQRSRLQTTKEHRKVVCIGGPRIYSHDGPHPANPLRIWLDRKWVEKLRSDNSNDLPSYSLIVTYYEILGKVVLT